MYSMRVYFFQTCAYQVTNNYDQINKLFGFSQGPHKWNSARIGWRCKDGEFIELFAYCYIDGKEIVKPLLRCKPESWVFCNIQNRSSKYVFKVLTPNGKGVTMSIDKNQKLSIYSFFKLFIYRLFPYFGGKKPSPCDMKLYLIKLKMD